MAFSHPTIKVTEKCATANDSSTATTSGSESRKRGGTYAQLYNLGAKKNRTELFQSSIPNWIEAKSIMDFNSEKAQRYHKTIFEWMMLDLMPFHAVKKPGFLRAFQVIAPNFNVASNTHYRNMLEPTYDRIFETLYDKLQADDPPTFSVGLDGWSAYHHGYLGVNCHYLNANWERITFNLACR